MTGAHRRRCNAPADVELAHHVRHRLRLLPLLDRRHVPRVLPARQATRRRRRRASAPMLRDGGGRRRYAGITS